MPERQPCQAFFPYHFTKLNNAVSLPTAYIFNFFKQVEREQTYRIVQQVLRISLWLDNLHLCALNWMKWNGDDLTALLAVPDWNPVGNNNKSSSF